MWRSQSIHRFSSSHSCSRSWAESKFQLTGCGGSSSTGSAAQQKPKTEWTNRVTGKVPEFAPHAKIIHVDIDPAELGKVRRPDATLAVPVAVIVGVSVANARAAASRGQIPGQR